LTARSVGGQAHPIEAESYRRLEQRVDLSGLAPGPKAVVARVIHATADLDYARTMVVSEKAVEVGIAALATGAPVVTDVEMVRYGLVPWVRQRARCYLEPAAISPPPEDRPTGTGSTLTSATRTSLAMRRAACEHPKGAILVVGCAPTALVEVVRLIEAGQLVPALVVGLPVGFVGAAEAKAALRASRSLAISNVGEKGGSAAAAAVMNALAGLTTGGADSEAVSLDDMGPGRHLGEAAIEATSEGPLTDPADDEAK
jgi:precorrin-8X/cobalt-precorrin-8 methylmutase